MAQARRTKVLVIGLDCATPQLVFDQFLPDLPNIRGLMERGVWGELESCIPAITTPAWACMMSSKNPGKLGIYGFRNRKNYSYDEMFYANALAVKEPRIWDILGAAGKKVVLVGIPQTYPPKPVNGAMITCFLTPDTNSQYTYPADLRHEVEGLVGNYILDVAGFRTDDKDYIVRQIWEMTEKRFTVVKNFLTTKEWDFFMMVEMGPDRIHHGLWKFFDRQHPKYEPGTKYEGLIPEYYRYLDQQIGEVLGLVGDNTAILVVSDHGAKRMDGGICLNDWLITEGYLVLKQPVTKPGPFKNEMVDWSKTRAWGSGGYYGRLFLNVQGREPQGVIPPGEYESVRAELIRKIEAIPDHKGQPLPTRAYRPGEIYPVVNSVAPDLIIYFGDLYWRAVGAVGNPTLHVFENDTGPDDANHAQRGIFIMANHGGVGGGRKLEGLQLMDVAPTILDILGHPIPADMEGKVIR